MNTRVQPESVDERLWIGGRFALIVGRQEWPTREAIR
jgi:hypothetical protein